MHFRSLACLLVSLSLDACVEPSADFEAPIATLQPDLEPAKFVPKADGIPSEYIVVMKDAVARSANTIDRIASRHGAIVNRRYASALRGFSARMSEHDARALATDPDVAFVEQDAIVRGSVTQSMATQGIDRIDQRNLPLDGNYTFTADGTGVTVFVLDSGIRQTHVEFIGRIDAANGGTAIDDGNGVEDCHGHGTHVSGTIAGTFFGVAKKATIVPIRVLDCNNAGAVSGIIAGIDFVAQNHPARSVANMSLGGGASDAIDASIRNLVASGVTVVVAAGNETMNACLASPAREPAAITVGSAQFTNDARSSFSNFGTCVDLFAPGSDITSAWLTADTSTNMISGTSMASPHVAGVAALFLSQNPTATPAQVAAAILASATPGKVTDLQGSPNLLLHSNVSAAPPTMGGSKITAPMNGATVGAMFEVTADAANATMVALAVDGQQLVVDNAAPFAFTVSNAPAGMHTVQITATFAGGTTATDMITIMVGGGGNVGQNPTPPPPPPSTDDDEDGGGCSATRRAGGGAGAMMLWILAVFLVRRTYRPHRRAK